MGTHCARELWILLLESLHVGRRSFVSNLTLIEIIVDDSDIQNVIDEPVVDSPLFEERLGKEMMIVLAVGLFQPVIRQSHDRVIDERLRLVISQEAQNGLYVASPGAKPPVLLDEFGRDIDGIMIRRELAAEDYIDSLDLLGQPRFE